MCELVEGIVTVPQVQAEATRANAIYAREIVIGLPTELSREQQVALMRDYVRAAFTSRGMVADWVIHDKAGNPHAHVMLTTKPLSESGFASNVTPLRDDAGQPVRTAAGFTRGPGRVRSSGRASGSGVRTPSASGRTPPS